MTVAPEEYAEAFGAILDEENQCIFDSSFGNLSKTWMEQIIAQTDGREAGEIVWKDRQFLFSRMPAYVKVAAASGLPAVEQFSQIAFLDITQSNRGLEKLLAAFVGVGVLTLLTMLGISILFATRAVAPIERSYQKQKQFVQDASHELKTPLASIRVNLEALQANEQAGFQSQMKWLDHISHKSRRMSKLVAELLELARADQPAHTIKLAPMDLSKLLERTLLSVEPVLYEKEISFRQQIEPGIFIGGDPDKVEQVVGVLLDNACKYTNPGGCVEVCLYRQKKYVLLTVSNTGAGIPPEHLDKIFDRFYRVDDSRTHTGGYGLGLSIAKTLVEQMAGTLSVWSIPQQSTTFTVRWTTI